MQGCVIKDFNCSAEKRRNFEKKNEDSETTTGTPEVGGGPHITTGPPIFLDDAAPLLNMYRL